MAGGGGVPHAGESKRTEGGRGRALAGLVALCFLLGLSTPNCTLVKVVGGSVDALPDRIPRSSSAPAAPG